MTTLTADGPNTASAAPVQNAVPSLDSIAAKMAAMRNQPVEEPQTTATGDQKSPVAPEGSEVLTDDDTESIQPEVDPDQDSEIEEANEEAASPDEVSTEESSAEELIDFIEFAETNPNAKFKFTRNGKEVVIDAKKAAAILGQGGAIHEEARQLKIQQSEFNEYVSKKASEAEGLVLAMEFTVRPQLQKAYDEIIKTQNYQTTFKQQLAQTQDPAQVARIQAAMQQNEQYIRQQGDTIKQLKPNVEQFYQIRGQQVAQALESSRKAFKDAELRNEYVFNEIKEKVARGWDGAQGQMVPGIKNIDLISADEHLMSLLRDGMKYREKPRVKSSGSSIAALTSKRTSSGNNQRPAGDDVAQLRERAKSGDKKAGDNLLVAQLQKIRAARSGR